MPATTIDPIVQRLHALTQSSPELSDAARLYEIILPLIRDADLRVDPVDLPETPAREKLAAGMPLLHDINLALDDQAARELMIRLARALEELRTESEPPKYRLPWTRGKTPDAAALAGDGAAMRASAARSIRLALEENRLDLGALLAHATAGDNGFVNSIAQSMTLDPGLLWTLAQNAVKPALRVWARQVSPLVTGTPWHHGYCFVCGAAATLAEFQGNDQEKHLRCGQCGADWRFPRVRCLFCGNADPKTFSYLYPERARDQMRVEICDNCHGYLKVIAAFSPTPVELLAVEDLATLPLDYIAHARGYARVPLR